MPEISINDPFGLSIIKCIRQFCIKKVLEIGAFNGDGSTQVLIRALESKRSEATLFTLEERPDRFEKLLVNIQGRSWIHPLLMSSIGWESFTARDFETDVWSSPYHGFRYPKEQVAIWHADDLARIRQIPSGFLEGSRHTWDAVLIDGGEFFGWDEFRLLRSCTRCFFLDDAFHAFKTFRVQKVLEEDPDWRLFWADARLRNGAAIYVHQTLPRESRFFGGFRFL